MAQTITSTYRVLSFTRQLIANNRNELSRADTKASQGLAAAGAVAISLFTAITSHTWSPTDGHPVRWTWWVGCGFWMLAVATLMLALMPRLGAPRESGEGPPSLTYFGDVHRHRGADAIRAALAVASRQPLHAAIRELSWTSSAVLRKYRLIRVGLGALAGSAVLLMASVL
jgi:hypothetical protein